ncbi:hypothetical protein BKA64DRAFT_707252 [Cadophora sp. MPI-SDFR-AT-0126]|nr:hypothetical protein BKA64DRAFT_707252 [Leotiomycetes sp. MPI-SDFR-AT-0126]
MSTPAADPFDAQLVFQNPPQLPPTPGYFDYLPTFTKFPKLPLEICEMIWKLCLPCPEVLTAHGYESRDVYLKAFPISLPTEQAWNEDKAFSGANRGIVKSKIHISPRDRLFVVNMHILVDNPYLEEALDGVEWLGVITMLYVFAALFISSNTNHDLEGTFYASVWKVFKAFPNLKDLRGVVPNVTWDRIRNEEQRTRGLSHLGRIVHGLEKELPMLGLISTRDMNAMREKVLRVLRVGIARNEKGNG